jgi:hypothetical protein
VAPLLLASSPATKQAISVNDAIFGETVETQSQSVIV